jgi:hypothetical protein
MEDEKVGGVGGRWVSVEIPRRGGFRMMGRVFDGV